MNPSQVCMVIAALLFLGAFFSPVFYTGTSTPRWKLEIAGLFFMALSFVLGMGALHA